MASGTDPALNLFASVAKGDQAAFQRIYADNVKWVLALALRLLRDKALAEDAVQETFVKIWRSAHRYNPATGSLRGWIGVIARNTALDLIRKRRLFQDAQPDDILPDMVTLPSDPPDMKLQRCLSLLATGQADAIVTMYTYGMSHAELADHLALPIGTVKSWIRRGTHSLKQCMEQ